MSKRTDRLKGFICTLVSFVALNFALSAAAEDLELKGITVDVKADCEKLNSIEMRQGTISGRGPSECVGYPFSNYQNTFLGHEVFYAISQNPDGTIVKVEVADALFASSYDR
jgi:hypothetical protein